MLVDDQSRVIAFLRLPSSHGGAPVEVIETHSAMVFLAGGRALKLKRAVRFDYLDFSTEELRRAACEAEVGVNRRAAPDIYLGVIAVTRERDGSLALGGPGAPVDWLVHMRRFDQEALFDRLASRGALDLALMRPLASAIAAFHRTAPPRPDQGGYAGMRWVIDGNAAGFGEQGDGILDPSACDALTTRARDALASCTDLLERRRTDGFVRQCHGDLHLRNLVLLDGRPTLFDAIEFNDAIACGDVLYDLAFLLMDLVRRGLPRHANEVLNGYLDETDDLEGLRLLPLFLSCRAAVRAKTSATAATLQTDPRRRPELEELAREYLRMAMGLLQPAMPVLVAIGGFSGSGKSTLARTLARAIPPAPGALVIRSDELRKRLSGVGPLMRLGPDAYSPEMTARVYRGLEARAHRALAAGHSAIVDAVYAAPADRLGIEAIADGKARFLGLWLEAPEQVLLARVNERTADASDADAAVVRRQLANDGGRIEWRRIDGSAASSDVCRKAEAWVLDQ
jgi:aminoglycoside phosphotransferase family enzyme